MYENVKNANDQREPAQVEINDEHQDGWRCSPIGEFGMESIGLIGGSPRNRRESWRRDHHY
jgi:hypothetical protein